ncbi:MAG: hypothetical protein ACFBWO_14390 [Paracoccaceae bacterium]
MSPPRGARLATAFAAALAAMAPAGAAAQGFTLDGSLSQNLSLDTNPSLDSDRGGGEPISFGSNTRLSLNGRLATQRSSWRLATGFGFRYRTNRDEDQDALRELFEPTLRLSGQIAQPRFALSPGLTFRRRRLDSDDTAFADDFGDTLGGLDLPDFDDDGFDVVEDELIDQDTAADDATLDDVETTEIRVAPSLGLSVPLSPRTSLGTGVNASFRRVGETTEQIAGSTSFGANASLRRSVSQRTDLTLSFAGQRFLSELETARDATLFNTRLGITRTASPRLSFSASGGLVYTLFDERDIGAQPSDEDSTLGFSGSLAVDYRTAARRFSLGAAQSVSPSANGDLSNRTSLFASADENLTRRHSLTLRLRLSRSRDIDADGGDGDGSLIARVSPGLSYDVSRNWSARLSYAFLIGSNDGDLRLSNGATLTLTRDLALYP